MTVKRQNAEMKALAAGIDAAGELEAVCKNCPLRDCGMTPMEKLVAVHLLRGEPRFMIAEALGISGNTVKTHSRHIYKKTGTTNQRTFMAKHLIKTVNKDN